MKPLLKLAAVLVLFVGVTYVIPFDEAEQFLAANFFSTEAEFPSAPALPVNQEEVVQKKAIVVSDLNEFVLQSDRKGTENYTIPQNTCRHGVRIVIRSTLETDSMSADLHVFGFSRKQSRETYSMVHQLTQNDPVKILHLPSELLYSNDTLFPEYQITQSRNSEYLRYDVMCY